MGSVNSSTDDGMLEIGGEDGKLGQGRGMSSFAPPNFSASENCFSHDVDSSPAKSTLGPAFLSSVLY